MEKEIKKPPEGFSTLEEVLNIQNTILMTISAQKHSRGFQKNSLTDIIITKELQELKRLKEYFENKEKAFYKRFKIKGYEDFVKKVEEWNRSGINDILQNEKIIKSILEIFDNISYADLTEVIMKFSDQNFNSSKLQEEFFKENGLLGDFREDVTDNFFNIVKTGLKGGNSKRSGTLFLTFEDKDGKFFSSTGYTHLETIKGITLLKKKKSKEVEIHFTKNISSKNRKELTGKLKKILKDQNIQVSGTSLQEIRDQISEVLKKHISSEIKKEIVNAFNITIDNLIKNSTEIVVNNNTSVIRGALGELYWNAFAEYFGIEHRAVGESLKSLSGKQIPVDIAFEEFGAQVKNYIKTNGIVTFNQHFEKSTSEMVPNQISLYNFFGGASYLHLSDPEIFGKFYFSEFYNKEIKEGSSRYSPIAKRFPFIHTGIDSYIKASLSSLLNMDKNIQLKNANLLQENYKGLDPGKPVFFFIGDKILPSSIMIDNIIKGLDSTRNRNELINIEIVDYQINLSGFKSFIGGKRYPQSLEKEIDISTLMKSKNNYIKYRINVNVDNIIDEIIKPKN